MVSDREAVQPGEGTDPQSGPAIADHEAAQYRIGVIGGVGAYTMWGLFPLFFHLLEPTSPLEIIGHRVIWTAVLMVGVLSLGAGWTWVRPLLADRRRTWSVVAAGFLLSANWLIYVWAVTNDRVIDASLGYFINPLVTVLLGVVILGEHLRRLQWAAVAAGAVSVLVLVLGYGAVPWVSLGLAASFGTYGLLKKQVGLGPVEALTAETFAVAPVALVGMGWALLAGELDFPGAPVSMKLLLLAAGPDPLLDRMVSDWLAGYDLLIQVPILAAPQADGIRAADPAFQRAVDERLRAEVAARGIATLGLDAARSADWLDEVETAALCRLRPAQLELL